jgi:hypothetical protein
LTTWGAFGKFKLGCTVYSIRGRLIALASTVLACQLAAFAAAPILLHHATTTSAGSELLCDCKVEPGAECPMHGGKAHGAAGKRSGGTHLSPVCGDQTVAVLTLLAGGGGILATPSQIICPATTGVAVAALTDSIIDASRAPTSPPPRS